MELIKQPVTPRSSSPAPLLIGLCAPAMGSGKTTFAQCIEHDHDFKRRSFASPMKQMFIALLRQTGLSEFDALEIITDTELKEAPLRELGGKTARYALQTLGTEWGRDQFDKDFWVRIGLAAAIHDMSKGRSVVFDDVRFKNEADAIKDAGGYVIRVIRPGFTRPIGGHTSEGELDCYPADYEVLNDKCANDLRYQTDYILEFITT